MCGPRSSRPAACAGSIAPSSKSSSRPARQIAAGVTGRLGRGDEQKSLGRGWQHTDLAEEVLFESPADGERLGQRHGSGELVGRQLSTELDERERVATRLGDEASADVVGQRPLDGRVQERARRRVGERGEAE